MTKIILITFINAPIEKCFDLSRDVNIHIKSAHNTNERVISGRNEGLFELNDIVTWRAKHFSIYQNLTVQITKLDYPRFFEDKMLKGAFKSMVHKHYFEDINGTTKMTDEFEYEVPFNIIGKLFDNLILKKYMTNFLLIRNKTIKEVGERRYE